jgi:peptide/nickel transport system substrate-binding protein
VSRRDGAFVFVFVLVLGVLGAAIAAPAFTPAAAPQRTPPAAPAVVHREAVVGQPSSVNPVTARTQADRDLVALLFRGLVRSGEDGRPVADLAAGWTVEAKGARWTFRLRADARWQDGVPVTSDDVVYTVRVLQDPAYTGPLAAGWQGVTATAIDAATVRLDLAVPLGGFLQAAAQPLLPAHLLAGVPVAELADAPFSMRPVGNGPFALTELTTDAAHLEPVLEPLDLGPGPLATLGPGIVAPGGPLLAALELRFFPGPDEAAAAYRAGEVDAVSGLPPAAAMALAAERATRRIAYPGTTLTGVYLNLRPGAGPFSDARVRTALLAALDRGGLVTDLLAGSGQRADTPIPPSSWAYDPKAPPAVAYDRKVAAAGLRAAGWTRAGTGWLPPRAKKPVTIELLAIAATVNPVTAGTAARVAAAWTSLGIPTTVRSLAAGDLVDRLRSAEFVAAVADVNVGLDPDPYPLLASSQVQAGGSNVSGFQDPALDAALAAARAPGTDAARAAAYTRLQALLGQLEPILPLFFRDSVFVVSDRLLGPRAVPVADPSGRFWDVITWSSVGR